MASLVKIQCLTLLHSYRRRGGTEAEDGPLATGLRY